MATTVWLVIDEDRQSPEIGVSVWASRDKAIADARECIEQYRNDSTIPAEDIDAALADFDADLTNDGQSDVGAGDPNCRFWVEVRSELVRED
jgi:hypothetical protein